MFPPHKGTLNSKWDTSTTTTGNPLTQQYHGILGSNAKEILCGPLIVDSFLHWKVHSICIKITSELKLFTW